MSQTVRTVFEPDRDIEVSDREAVDLKRQGLLVETPAPATRKTVKNEEN